ncbi:amino acid adenylation domain-containing protein [Streptomyces sp. NPDC014894]|uniref:amino acid adenylation domain-containing protein n=1 Tax=Streptomyces sp. NPDC014894 TaxID=3364931 RepID=UPI0036FDBB34
MTLLDHPSPLIAALARRAAREPERLGYFEAVDAGPPTGIGYADLVARVETEADRLAAATRPGQRVALALPGGLDYVAALLGCLAAGRVAVPLPPSRGLGVSADDLMRHPVIRDAGAVCAVTAEGLVPLFGPGDAAAEAAPAGVAVLQYTSGSTGAPKGVIVGHDNLARNCAAITEGMGLTEADRSLVWLPPYHDMGLVGGILAPLWSGMSMTLLAPEAFARRPLTWLQLVSDGRMTLSGGPNFAFDACVDRIAPEDRAALDLSAWQVAFIGAEPVRARTLRRFAEAFAPAGFRPEAYYPCYGLAEATLIVSGGRRGGGLRTVPSDVPGQPEQVSCGRVLGGQELRVIDPDTGAALPAGGTGEIVLSGPCVTAGYWRNPEATAAARTPDGALRTGDLGRVVAGELHITGRSKDTVVIHGRNLFPEDLEEVVHAVDPALAASTAAAFSVESDGGEQLVVAVESSPRTTDEAGRAALLSRVRVAVARAAGVQPAVVLLCRRGALPRTTSGKVRRSAARDLYAGGGLRVLAEDRSRPAAGYHARARLRSYEELDALPRAERGAALTAALCEWIVAATGTSGPGADAGPRPDPADPLVATGLDSLGLVQLQGDLAARWSVALDLATLYRAPSLTALAEDIADRWGRRAAPADVAASAPDAGLDLDAGAALAGESGFAYLEARHPGTSAHVLARAFRLAPDTGLAPIEAALQLLGARHRALRGVGPQGPEIRLAVHEAAGLSERAVEDLLRRAALTPFDLAAGPLLRAEAIRTAEATLLVLAVHHTAVDLWSASLLAAEFAAAHRAFADGVVPALPEPGDPARAVAARRARTTGPAGDRLRAWWAEAAADSPPTVLPADRARSGRPTLRAGAVSRAVPGLAADALAAFAAELGTTPFTVLVTALNAVLAGYGGPAERHDVVIGAPVSGRGDPDTRATVGFLASPVPLRTRVDGDPTFGELASRVHAAATAALEHQGLSFPAVVEAAGASRTDGGNPLYDALFVYHQPPRFAPPGTAELAIGLPGTPLDLGGLRLEAVALPPADTPVELTVEVAHTGTGSVAVLRYAVDVFTESTATAMLDRFLDVLNAALSDPGLRVSDLSAARIASVDHPTTTGAGAGPREAGADEPSEDAPHDAPAHAPAAPEPRDAPAHALPATETGEPVAPEPRDALARPPVAPGHRHALARIADLPPDAVAVRQGAASLSYGALRRRAARLARRLARLGVGPEAIVAVALPRTLDLPVGLLGVLAAGGAFCPLDLGAPASRLRAVLDDARPAAILAVRATAASVPVDPDDPAGPPIVLLDEEDGSEPAPAGAGAAPPRPLIHPDQLAHVLFTSGSTGRPKGVALTHRGLAALADWAAAAYTDEERAGVLAGTALTFDLSVFELFATWCAGGTVVLARDALQLTRLPERGHVTLVNTVPSIAAQLLADGLPDALRTVNLAGEPLPRELARALAAAGPARVENLYGPTEASTYATAARIAPADDRLITIGTPLPAVGATVRADGMREAADGVPGELHLAGAHLARGYLRRPGPTARSFVPDPAAARPGERVYRTGDTARRRPDGDLVFLGRTDRQVKIRGVRIELDEIEAVLTAHPGVREAAVRVHRAGEPDAVLVAHVAGTADVAALRSHAAARLPGAMLPGRWSAVERLPRDERGKVDRRALAALPEPAPAVADAASGDTPARALTPAEAVVAEVWGRLLAVEAPDPDQDFIEAGGHSLLAVRLLSELEEVTGVRLGLDRLFDTPTIAGVARELANANADADVVPAAESWASDTHPLSSTQERLHLLHLLDPLSPAYHVAARVRLTGPLDPARLERALRAVVDRHAGLRVRFVTRDGVVVQQAAVTLPVRLPVEDLPDESAAAPIEAHCAREPFDPAAAPPWRARLLRTAADDHRLIFVAHHLICDGWSLELLARDLGAAYRADKPLPPAVASILDVGAEAASTSRERPTPGALWWRERLHDLPDLRLPASRTRDRDAVPTARQAHCDLPPTTAAELDAVARTHGATRFMAVAGLVAALLGAQSGQERFGLGVAVQGRTGPDHAEVFGCLADTLVVRADLAGTPSLRDVLARTRAELLGALAHADTPFAEVVGVSAPGRAPASTPLFQVMIGDQPAATELDLGTVRAVTTPLFAGVAKFDLSVLTGPAPGGGLRITFEYDDTLLDPAVAELLPERLARLVRGVLADPGAPLALVDLAAPAERDRLTATGDGGPVPDLGTPWLHEAVLAPAARVPDRVAVTAPGESVTYAALARRTARLAAGLRARGVGPEDRVAICHRRTADLPAAMLGVLAAGAAYLPLRAADPAERRAAMIADAGAVLVLTDGDTASWLDSDVPVVTVDELVASAPADGPGGRALVDPRQLAYVLYTSGSTGRPKGVAVTHQGALARIAWGRRAFGDEELAGVLAATSLVFDLSLFELFAPLAAGGTAVIAESVLDLPGLPDRDRVALVTTVPSGMAALLDMDAWPGTVRTVGLGGEALSPRLARRVWERGPHRVVNLYGTTEDSFCSTWTDIAPDAAHVTAGRPLPGSRIAVVNAALAPVPPEAPGEIVSGGLGVSRGYLGRPGATAAAFVPDPDGRPGDRRYRTGDRGRRLPDGLEVTGRMDQQVKIRGHRVEPGEVEAAVLELPAVAEAVVLAVPGHGDRGRRLVAYLRPHADHGEGGTESADIRAALRRRLPDYMVPADFVFVPELPRTASGKVDRAALGAVAPEPAPERRPGDEPPAAGVETEVARIWQELIGVARVGRQDRFFDIGGDSLLAARMTARLNDRFGTAVSLRQIFEDDRLSVFADEIDRAALGAERPARG